MTRSSSSLKCCKTCNGIIKPKKSTSEYGSFPPPPPLVPNFPNNKYRPTTRSGGYDSQSSPGSPKEVLNYHLNEKRGGGDYFTERQKNEDNKDISFDTDDETLMKLIPSLKEMKRSMSIPESTSPPTKIVFTTLFIISIIAVWMSITIFELRLQQQELKDRIQSLEMTGNFTDLATIVQEMKYELQVFKGTSSNNGWFSFLWKNSQDENVEEYDEETSNAKGYWSRFWNWIRGNKGETDEYEKTFADYKDKEISFTIEAPEEY